MDYETALREFMDTYIYPNEDTFDLQAATAPGSWQPPEILSDLKAKARSQGLWNLFLPDASLGPGLSTADYAPLAEVMGRVTWASEVFNCSAPDTGNMEVLWRYGSADQKKRWLRPLLDGEIRSAFLMTEPDVASSDATNISTIMRRDGDTYVITGRKWFASGVMDPRCRVWIVMGKTDPDAPPHLQQSQILVEPDTRGVRIERAIRVMRDFDPPHGHAEVTFDEVRVPASNVFLGEGRGFEIAQGRLGPGRVHHCMRTIGLAERALELMCRRLSTRYAFGTRLSENGHWEQRIGESRVAIEMARQLTLSVARKLDALGGPACRADVAMIKVAVPRMARAVIDSAIQAFGAAGVSDDFRLPAMYAAARWVSIADGPDEVHNRTIARMELKRYL